MTSAPPAVGSLFARRYRIIRPIGKGGMGSVYEVVDVQTDRRRALKVMLAELASDPDLSARFRREATVAGRVESEHIVEVFDAGIDDETAAPYLVMELLRGKDLGALLQEPRQLPAADVAGYLGQVAFALDRMHDEGIVHRDLKPENLFVSQRDDGSPRLKVLDFGIAKALNRSASWRTTRSIGTPLYMAPEQLDARGDIDARADLYALAHITFALLVGSAYWEPELRAASSLYPFLVSVMRGPPEAASQRARALGVELPMAFDGWFAKAAAKDPEDRFERAGTQIVALAEALGLAPAPFAPLARARSVPPSENEPVPAREGDRATTAVVASGPLPPPERRVLAGRLGLVTFVGAVIAIAAAVAVARWAPGSHAQVDEGLSGASPATPASSASTPSDATEAAPTSSAAEADAQPTGSKLPAAPTASAVATAAASSGTDRSAVGTSTAHPKKGRPPTVPTKSTPSSYDPLDHL